MLNLTKKRKLWPWNYFLTKILTTRKFDYTFNSAAVQLNLTENFGHASAFMSCKIIFQLINALAFIKQLTNYTGNERERG